MKNAHVVGTTRDPEPRTFRRHVLLSAGFAIAWAALLSALVMLTEAVSRASYSHHPAHAQDPRMLLGDGLRRMTLVLGIPATVADRLVGPGGGWWSVLGGSLLVGLLVLGGLEVRRRLRKGVDS